MWQDGGKIRKMLDAAAANLEWLGLNLCRMNRGGLNHVTYYEPEKRRGSEGRAEQRGGNIMDKGSNEAERARGGEIKERRVGESNVEGRGRKGEEEGRESRVCCRVESRRGGARGREARECASLPAFLTLRLCLYA